MAIFEQFQQFPHRLGIASFTERRGRTGMGICGVAGS